MSNPDRYIYQNNPIHSKATKEMIDELTEEGFIGINGLLTRDGERAAKVIKPLFNFVDKIKK